MKLPGEQLEAVTPSAFVSTFVIKMTKTSLVVLWCLLFPCSFPLHLFFPHKKTTQSKKDRERRGEKMESSIKPVSSPPDWKAAVEEMNKGRELAARLGALLHELPPARDHAPESSMRVLVEEVLGSFSRALLALDSGEKSDVLGGQATAKADDRRSEISSGKMKIPPVRGGAHRRRAHPYSRTRITAKTLDDGYTWRKYGQKEIYNAKFPRSYYRCTHKLDRGCQATRQVQRSEEDPSMFVINHIGEHTCRDPAMDIASSHHRTPYLISFGLNASNVGQEPLPFPPPKQEPDEEVLSDITRGSSSSEYFVLRDLMAFEGSAPPMEQPAGDGPDHGDVTSGLRSTTSSLVLDFNIEDMLNFYQDELF